MKTFKDFPPHRLMHFTGDQIQVWNHVNTSINSAVKHSFSYQISPYCF